MALGELMGRHKDKQGLKASIPWLIGSGALALVSVGGWIGYGLFLNRSPDPLGVHLSKAERGTVERTINASGTVQLREQQTLTSPVDGAVEEILVQPGDRIQTGQVLLVLRNPERQTALSEQQIKIDRQEIILARDRQRIIEAQQQLALQQKRLQGLTELAQTGAIAQTEVQEQEERVRTTLVELRTAEADTRTAVLDLENLKLERQRIRQELANTVITSPLNGIVLGVNVRGGDGVERRTELLTLGDPSQELVQMQLTTLDAAKVKVNQAVRVSVIGPDPEIYAGRIQSLYPQAIVPGNQGQSGGASGEESGQAIVPTIARLNTPSRTLIPGAQVNVEIILEQRRNVVMLNIEAIQRSPSNTFVWVIDANNRAQQQPITLGLESLTTVEIISGLNPGDSIILPPTDTPLTPGTPVRVESQSDN